jgi:hypothetical protein
VQSFALGFPSTTLFYAAARLPNGHVPVVCVLGFVACVPLVLAARAAVDGAW